MLAVRIHPLERGKIMEKTLVGKRIKWSIEIPEPEEKVQYEGVIIKERPGWSYWVYIRCDDGVERNLCLSSTMDHTGKYTYKPKYEIESDND
jgi:hypothetical protein